MESRTPVMPGDLIGGKYRVQRTLGEGGMGIVLAAEHVHVGESVAIKILKADALARPEMLTRFVREARTAMKLKSEHVVRVFDVDMLGGSHPYIVMEMLDGRDLATIVAEDGPVAVRVAIDWVLQACESIAEAHALGVVHRDLKPANLFLTKRPDGTACIKVLDFGVSKVAWIDGDDVGMATAPSSDPHIAVSANARPAAPGALTQTNATLGSPRYMSPEQLLSARDVDTRADVWALGATLFELLAGRSPFVGATTEELTARIRNDDAPSLRSLRPSVPTALDAALAKCLRKDPNERFSDVARLAEALAPFGSDEAARSVVAVRAILHLEAIPHARSRVALVVLAVLVVAVVAVTIPFALRARAIAPVPASPTASTELRASTTPPPALVEFPTSSSSVTPTAQAIPRARATMRDAGVAAKPDASLDPAHAFDQPD